MIFSNSVSIPLSLFIFQSYIVIDVFSWQLHEIVERTKRSLSYSLKIL